MSFISNDEMRRLNIEVSYAIARLAHIYHERGFQGMVDVLTRAYIHLPMPQRAVQMDREVGQSLINSLETAGGGPSARSLPAVPAEHADRAIANVLALWGWRDTEIERTHAGTRPPHPLRPHQRRIRPRDAGRLLRDVSGKLGSYYFWWETIFDAAPATPDLPHWPDTATALADSFLGMRASRWSLTEPSSTIWLPD